MIIPFDSLVRLQLSHYPSAKDTCEKRLSVGKLEDIVLKGGISYIMPSLLAASIHDDFNQIVVISSDIRHPTSDIRHPSNRGLESARRSLTSNFGWSLFNHVSQSLI